MLRVAVNCFVIPNYVGLIAKWKQFFCLIGVWVWLCFVLFCFCLMSQIHSRGHCSYLAESPVMSREDSIHLPDLYTDIYFLFIFF